MSTMYRRTSLKLFVFLISFLNIYSVSGLDSGKYEDETIQIVILVHPHNKLLNLPYLFGSIESQYYDFQRVRIHFITERLIYSKNDPSQVRTFHDEDDEQFWIDSRIQSNRKTIEIIKFWIKHNEINFNDLSLTIREQDIDLDSGYYDSESDSSDSGDDSYWNTARFQRIMNAKNHELMSAYQQWSDFVLFFDCDVILVNPYTFKNITQIFQLKPETVVASPMLHSFGTYSNFWGAMDSKGYYQRSEDYLHILERKIKTGIFTVPMVHSFFMIDLRKRASRKLTFDPRDIDISIQVPFDDIIAFAKSAQLATIPFSLDNRHVYGYIPPSMSDKASPESEIVQTLVNLELDSLKEGPAFPVSRILEQFVEPLVPFPDKLGVDQVYVINLKRRPERRKRMESVLRLLGIDAQFWIASDGKSLNQSFLDRFEIETFPGYVDPYHKRPVTFGEIGCFLSHYRIWEDAHRNNYSKIIVLEDDANFVHDFRSKWAQVLSDFESIDTVYDFLYLGRKLGSSYRSEVRIGERFVEPHYSYWTVAYLLTGNGIQKLLHSNPLRRLLPVDEYLPLMFGVHSNTSLMEAFTVLGPAEKVNSLSANPLLVFPTHYVGDAQYISDTEDSLKVSDIHDQDSNYASYADFKNTENEFDYETEDEHDDRENDNTIDYNNDQFKGTPVLLPPPDSNSISHFEL